MKAINLPPWPALLRRSYSSEQLTVRYDRKAQHWPQLIAKLGFDQAYQRLFADLRCAGLLKNIGTGSTVLDVGIGAADVSLALVHALDSPPHITGVDLSASMLAVAAQRLQTADVPCTLVHQDVRALSIPPSSMDLMLCAHTLEHLPDPAQGVRILAEAARPGASVVIIMTRQSLLGSFIAWRWRTTNTTRHDLCAWMQAAGLEQVHVRTLAGPPWCNWLSVAAIGVRA